MMDRAFTIAYEDAAFEELLMYTTNYTPAEIAERAYLLGLRRLTAIDIGDEVDERATKA